MYAPLQRAEQSFVQARRQAGREQWLARLGRSSAALRCYSELHRAPGDSSPQKLGVQEIPLAAIVGSVERCSDYTRSFAPLKDSDRARWTRVLEAFEANKRLPPIKVYRVGDLYYVADGHHRVSVARQLGRLDILAQVVDVTPATSLTRREGEPGKDVPQ
jgi:uncharacterized ParB-like nuclease family protein